MKRMTGILMMAAFTMVACKPAEETGSIGQENSAIAGASLQARIESGAGAFRVQQAAFGGECYAFSGNAADLDQDQIPVDITLTFNGCMGADSRGVASVNGVESIRDDDPALSAYLFTADADVSVSIIAAGGETLTVTYDGTARGSQPGSEFRLDIDAVGTIDAAAGEDSFSFEETVDWSASYAPATLWMPGQPPVAGTYSVQGDWNVSVDSTFGSGTADANVTTTSPLLIDPACATLVVGGSVQASYAGPDENRALSVTWTGCGLGTVNYSESPAGS